MTESGIRRARGPGDRDVVGAMVWEFFGLMRQRYPDMAEEIDDYVAAQDVAGQLADFDRFFTPPRGECFLAVSGMVPAGTVMIRPHGDGSCELNRMFVRPDFRGQGLGRLLCAAVIDEARAFGYRTVFLDALYRHVEALPLYRSMGFVEYSDPGAFKADDPRVIHMRLNLT